MEYDFLTFYMMFFIYSFLGWCFESCYVSIKEKKWVNRGFMTIPFLPIYGFGAVSILFATLPFISNPVLVYIVAFITATVLELVTGLAMERLFKVKYWDYSKNFLNYKGCICLKSSITWGFMGLLITYVINKPIADFVFSMTKAFTIGASAVLTVIFVIDFVRSFNAAYDLRNMILNNEKLMSEIKDIKKEITAAIENSKEHAEEKRAAFAAEIKDKMEVALSYTEFDDYIKEKIKELKDTDFESPVKKLHERIDNLRENISSVDKRRTALLRRNPSAGCNNGFLREIRAHIKKGDN